MLLRLVCLCVIRMWGGLVRSECWDRKGCQGLYPHFVAQGKPLNFHKYHSTMRGRWGGGSCNSPGIACVTWRDLGIPFPLPARPIV